MNGFHHNEVGSVKKNEVGDTYKGFDIDNRVEHMFENIGKDHFRGNLDIDKCLDEMFDEFKCEMPDIDTIVREYLNKGYNHDFKQQDIDLISSGSKLRMPNIREQGDAPYKLPIEQSTNYEDRNQSEITGKEENIPPFEKIESAASFETTREQSIEQQDKVIDEVDSGDKELETDQEKGNYGEMKTDQDLRKRGYERISKDIVTSLDNKTHKGILTNVDYNSVKSVLKPEFSDSLTIALEDYLKGGSVEIQTQELKFPSQYFHLWEFLKFKEDTDIFEIVSYVSSKWYNSCKDMYWYDTHNSDENIYVGYWCWLAAAIIKISGKHLNNDSSYRYLPVLIFKQCKCIF